MPLLVVLFGASDLVAKGTSLLVVIAIGMSGTIASLPTQKRRPTSWVLAVWLLKRYDAETLTQRVSVAEAT